MDSKKIKNSLSKIYDDLADAWQKDKSLEDWGIDELHEFANFINGKAGRVLDLGCGAGVQTKQLTNLGFKVIGVDLSLGMVQVARKNSPNSKFIVGDIEKLDFKPGYFDGIYARASLLHIKKTNIPAVLKKINKILVNNGTLYLALKEGKGERIVEDIKYGKKIKRFFSFYKLPEIKNLLQETGFIFLKSNKWSKNKIVWLHIFVKKLESYDTV